MSNEKKDILNVKKVIEKRKSSVLFSEEQISDNLIYELFNAARWAPSSFNQQPWRYIYGCKSEKGLYPDILNSLSEANRQWAGNATLLIVSIAEKISSHTHKMNKYAWHDTGMANALLMIQAVSLGLATHPMGGFDAELLREKLSIPERFEPVCVIAVGKKSDDTSIFDEELVKRENKARTRKPVLEIASSGFDNTLFKS